MIAETIGRVLGGRKSCGGWMAYPLAQFGEHRS